MTFGPRVLYFGGFGYSTHDPYLAALFLADGVVTWTVPGTAARVAAAKAAS